MKALSLIQITIALVLTTAVFAGNCGGNCPDNSCVRCLCGTQPSYVSIDEYCALGWRWNQNCCKCIVSKLSKGNQNFQRTVLFSVLEQEWLGVLPIQIENVEKVCNNIQKPTDLCDFRINAQCAEHFVIDNKKSWSLWSGAALGCGCPLNAE